MQENEGQSGGGESDLEEGSALYRVAVPLLTLVLVTAALYLARDLAIPIAAAVVLGVVLSPIAGWLERFVGRFFGAGLVVLTGLAVIGGVAYLTATELTAVADEVAGYSDNIGNKLAAIGKKEPLWLQHIESAVSDVQRRMQKAGAHRQKAMPVATVAVSSSPVAENLKRVTPALAAIVEALLVVVLLFFLLYSRRDLRDRFVRLAARARVTVAGQAIETAGHAVGRYLLLLSMINLSFGVAIGLVLWAMGLPNPVFWGLLAFLLRYIPYVGAATSSVLPALVAFAVFPGWSTSLAVIGVFVALDAVTVHLVEPFAIGSGIDMSPVALLMATMYWGWLWGLPGLLLAIPLTASLKVAGEHIPALNFLTLLLGGERVLESYEDFYRMLLELDSSSARTLAIRYCNENGLEQTFDDIVAPTVVLAGKERSELHISEDNLQFILDFMRDLVSDLGSRFCQTRPGRRPRVLGLCPSGEVHTLGLLMILELFRCAGASVRFLGEGKSVEQACEMARLFSPDTLCLSCTLDDGLPAGVELTKALKRELPGLTVIAGGNAAVSYPADLLRAGCSQICAGRSQTRRAIRLLAGIRARTTAASPSGVV